MIELLVVLAVVLVVVAVVAAPLRRARGEDETAQAAVLAELADLEAAKEAKYHEIRDAELDHRTGKLSADDFAALDGELRAQAVGLLKRIDAARARLDERLADATT